MSQPEEQQDRREMLRRGLRWAALGGITLGSGSLIARAISPPEDCRRAVSCRDCGSLASCELPAAEEARKTH